MRNSQEREEISQEEKNSPPEPQRSLHSCFTPCSCPSTREALLIEMQSAADSLKVLQTQPEPNPSSGQIAMPINPLVFDFNTLFNGFEVLQAGKFPAGTKAQGSALLDSTFLPDSGGTGKGRICFLSVLRLEEMHFNFSGVLNEILHQTHQRKVSFFNLIPSFLTSNPNNLIGMSGIFNFCRVQGALSNLI